MTNKFQTIIKKSENGNFYAKQKDKKKYAMFFQTHNNQQLIYIHFKPLYHVLKSFSFSYTSPSNECVFCVQGQNMLIGAKKCLESP
jgi:hypothetical protein